MRSAVSGKSGHKQEFLICDETHQPIVTQEAEHCEVTGRHVRPGILESCAVTQKRVVPSQLAKCDETGKRVLKRLLAKSSLSEAKVIETIAMRAVSGRICAPFESKLCVWSGRRYHPDDLKICTLTDLSVHFQFCVSRDDNNLLPLVQLLDGGQRNADETRLWEELIGKIGLILRTKRCKLEAAILSPSKQHLAACAEVRTLLGFRVQQVGLVYSIADKSVVGRIAVGQRANGKWLEVRR
jgi:hypothetical protein